MTTPRGSLIPIRARQASGLNVQVEAGVYWWNGELKEWAGGSLAISGDVPASSMKCPVIIAINGDGAAGAGTLHSFKGSDVAVATAPTTGVLFDEATIVDEINNAVAANDYLWFAMVPLSDGQTDNDDQDAILNFYNEVPTKEAISLEQVRAVDDTVTGQIVIDGGADEVQLSVEANATQTSAIMTLLDSSAVVRRGWDGNAVDLLIADTTTDTAPNDDTTIKKLSLQRLSAAPTNAAYIKFTNSPGTPTNDFYLVLEEG